VLSIKVINKQYTQAGSGMTLRRPFKTIKDATLLSHGGAGTMFSRGTVVFFSSEINPFNHLSVRMGD
jgi:hypothetical protein